MEIEHYNHYMLTSLLQNAVIFIFTTGNTHANVVHYTLNTLLKVNSEPRSPRNSQYHIFGAKIKDRKVVCFGMTDHPQSLFQHHHATRHGAQLAVWRT